MAEGIISKGAYGGWVTVRCSGIPSNSANLNFANTDGDETVDSMRIQNVWWSANTGDWLISRAVGNPAVNLPILRLQGSGSYDFAQHGTVIETAAEQAGNVVINFTGTGGSLVMKLKKTSTKTGGSTY